MTSVRAVSFLLDSAVERLQGGAARIEPDAELRLSQAVEGFAEALGHRAVAVAPLS